MSRARLLSALMVAWILAPAANAAVSASNVTTAGQLLNGNRADGQIGDLILENGEIAIIISAIGHVTHYGENGGTVIDAGLVGPRDDALGELYTYFDDDWPRQAVYTTLAVLNDGSGGGPAVIRASGHDVQDSGITVVTDYSLADGDRFLTVTTQITAGASALTGFELGDAFQWGDCSKFAQGLGYSVSGVTTQAWMAGISTTVAYAYGGTEGDCWGPNGNGYSDLNVTTVDLGPGASTSFTRYLAVAPAEIAAAVSILYQAQGQPTGAVVCNVRRASDGTAIVGALVDVVSTIGTPQNQMVVNAAGQAIGHIVPGTWRLDVSAPGYVPTSQWLNVTDGGVHQLEILMAGGGPGPEIAIGDTLTVIQRPLVNLPAMVLPGQPLEISCAASPATSGWQVEISYSGLTLPLPISSATYDASTTWWTLNTTVPAVPLFELYDLRVTADGGLDDTTIDAVKVLDQFKDDFYFIQISDTHLPDHRFSDSGGAPEDSTEIEDLRAVIADINLINPEFVLITGDFINEGELEDYLNWRSYTRGQRMLYEFATPTYLIAGNHDIGGWVNTPPPAGTARREWWRFFGWPRLDSPPPGAPQYTQNYSFDYGPVHVVGLESYDNYDLWRSAIYGSESFPALQLNWLTQDLAAASGSQARILFYHYDFQNQLNLESLGVEMALWGHVHGDRGDIQVQPYDLATNNVCDGERSYRLIRVSGGVLQPELTLSAGGSGQNLALGFIPANNGLSSTVTAQIVNNQPQGFEHGRVRFVMPPAGGNYVATGGLIEQVDMSGEFDIVHVAVDIQAAGSQDVTVYPGLSGTGDRNPRLELRLEQNHPNPFNPSTEFVYSLPRSGSVRLGVYDLQGHELDILVNQAMSAGRHTVRWNGKNNAGRDAPSGVYVIRLEMEGSVTSRKITLAR